MTEIEVLRAEIAALRRERDEARGQRDDLYGELLAFAQGVRRALVAETERGKASPG